MEQCGREDCSLYTTGRACREKCRKESITYRAVCERCKYVKTIIEQAYEGETSRTLYTRYKQHYADYTKAARLYKNRGGNAEPNSIEDSTSSWMWDHTLIDHAGEIGSEPHQDYHFHLVSNHRDPMTRQITEALRIEKSLGGNITSKSGKQTSVKSLNRRGEHFAPLKDG